MELLSCKNCCHNPLQLGGIGTSFGYCVRHRAALPSSHLTTCGQLLRKDLLRARARSEREVHAERFPKDTVEIVTAPGRPALTEGLVEPLNGLRESDPVVEEVACYGEIESKIGTIATLRRVPGARAEVAMLSLGRGYVGNCFDRSGPWTAGVHVLWWTLRRLADEPSLEASDVLGPIPIALGDFVDLAKWRLLVLRLAMVCDVADQASAEGDDVGGLGETVRRAIAESEPGDPGDLLRWLRAHGQEIADGFPPSRYEQLRELLHRRQKDDAS